MTTDHLFLLARDCTEAEYAAAGLACALPILIGPRTPCLLGLCR